MRFPEFSEEWKYSLLNEYLFENKERNKKGHFDKSDVLSVSGDFGIVNQIQLLGRSFAGKSVLDYHVVRCGDIVYTKSPLKEYPYGIVKVNDGIDGIVSTLYAVYKVKSNASGKFIESYFALPNRTNKYFKPIVRIGAKHDMKISNAEAIANIVCFPQYAEQQKIATFLCLIDARIATQSKIIEDLERLRSATYHRIFTSMKGKNVALKVIADIIKGQQINGTELSDNGDYYVMNGGIVPSGYYHKYNTPANTISISEGGSCGYVQFNHTPFWSGGHCYTLQILSKEIDLTFLYHYLKYKEKDIMALKVGSGLQNIQKKDLGNFFILLPTIEEQKKTTQIFDILLQKENLEKNMINRLCMQKQYLIRKMFI